MEENKTALTKTQVMESVRESLQKETDLEIVYKSKKSGAFIKVQISKEIPKEFTDGSGTKWKRVDV